MNLKFCVLDSGSSVGAIVGSVVGSLFLITTLIVGVLVCVVVIAVISRKKRVSSPRVSYVANENSINTGMASGSGTSPATTTAVAQQAPGQQEESCKEDESVAKIDYGASTIEYPGEKFDEFGATPFIN